MKKTSVLIVGAGPTGLMLACQLAIHDVPFIIVEKENGPTDESRALGIQARTLEIFAQMGIAQEFVKHGKPATGLNFMVNGKVIQHVPLTGLGTGQTAFPFLLTHEQSKTEANMLHFLKKHDKTVHYSTQVLTFTQNENEVTTTIKDKTGNEEKIISDWIIGADGAHSIVRHILKIPLTGKTYKQSLFVLDCKLQTDISTDDITVATSDESFAAFFPMSGNRWRVVGDVPPSVYGKDTISFSYVEHELGKRLKMHVIPSDSVWISLYHAHHRCVTHFRKGRAFLLGDASNIHSPIGAQGMNTGLQDAYNLAWKLAFVHQKKAKEEILDTYNIERLPVAQKLVRTTDRVFNLFISSNRLMIFAREHVFPHVVKKIISHRITGTFGFRTVSQIGISYHSSPLSNDASYGSFPKSAPKPGDRLPYVLFKQKENEINLQDLIEPTAMTLLVFPGKTEHMDSVRDVTVPYGKTIQVEELPLTPETNSLYTQLGIKTSGYYLVRPDMYIAYRGNTEDVNPLRSYLSRFFLL